MCYDLTRTDSQTHIQSGYGIHLSSYVCAIINKAEIAGRQTHRSAYQTRGGVGGASRSAIHVNKDHRRLHSSGALAMLIYATKYLLLSRLNIYK